MAGTLKRLERICFGAGIVLLAVWAAAHAHRAVMSRASLRAFEQAQRPPLAAPELPQPPLASGAAPARSLALPTSVDASLWSEQRVRGYRQSLGTSFAAPLAVLSIPKIGLTVPVLEGTDEVTLNRGVGHIEGTPRPGAGGNVGIAGHRDGFFRGLKDVKVGDRLEIATLERTDAYRIENIRLVSPDEVSVLDDTSCPTVTLVTCYPFYFVGNAPLRYIVKAVRVEKAP